MPLGRPFGKWALFAATAAALGCVTTPSHAVIVERVVAVVGDRPILLSDLRRRARPFVVRILQQQLPPPQRAAAESEMNKELLNKLIDERLEESAADKARIQVTTEEIDTALRNVASNAHITLPELFAAAKEQGLDEEDYREEIRRQIMEGKLIQLRVRSRVRVTDQDGRAAYQHYIQELGTQVPVDIEVIPLRLDGLTPDQVKEKQKLANRIVNEARAGADFCELHKKHAESQSPKKCGETGLQPTSALIPQIAAAVNGVAPGEITEPILIQNQAILVAKVVERRAPAYDDVKNEMMNRAYGEDMEQQRRQWLEELRRAVYLDVRL